MNILSMILVGGLAIGVYKYFKEKDFKESVNEKVSAGWDFTKEKVGDIKRKIFKKNKSKE